MDKKLPKVFANRNINKNNNEKTYHIKENDEIIQTNNVFNNTVNQKLKNIFNSNNFVYKMDVEITTNKGTFIKRIVGKNKKNLITIDNELILISDIVDIKIINNS